MARATDIVVEAVATLKEKLADLPDDQLRKLVIKTMKKPTTDDSAGDALVDDLKAALTKYDKPIAAKLWKEYTLRAWLELHPDGKARKTRPWDTFKSMKMKELKLANPNISFGDLMKAVSEAWKKEKAAAMATTSGESDTIDSSQAQAQAQTPRKRTEPADLGSRDVEMVPNPGPRRRVTRSTK